MVTQKTEEKLTTFDNSVRYLLERSDNGIRNGVNDSELNQILHVYKSGTQSERIALADRAAYYAELAKGKRVSSKEKDGEPTYTAKLTGYYPANTKMEGGFKDRFGNRLYTLQDYIEGNAPYVSVAADRPLSSRNNQPYITIPSLEAKYGMKIKFKICDTGGAFYGKGTERLDICTRGHSYSVASEVNAPGVEWYYDVTA